MPAATFSKRKIPIFGAKIEKMDTEYLNYFEEKLQQELLRLCTGYGVLGSTLLETEDIDARWNDLAPEYMADAVQQIRDYPIVSVAWAAYLGLAVAAEWDDDWGSYAQAPYHSYYGEQAFDEMDEHIVHDFLELPLDGEEAEQLANIIRRCGQTTVGMIRHEQIEPQSPLAFHIFARACRAMFRIGAAIELKRLGYKFEKVELGRNLNELPS